MSKKMPNVSFRIDEETIGLLKNLAAAENIALNAVVNRVLKEYVHVLMRAKQIDSKLVLGAYLRKVIELGETEQLKAIAREEGKVTFKMINETIWGPKNSSAFRNIVRDTFCYSSNWAKYSEERHGSKVVMIMAHQMGVKWSEMMKGFFSWEMTQLEDVRSSDVAFSCTDNSLVISFSESRVP